MTAKLPYNKVKIKYKDFNKTEEYAEKDGNFTFGVCNEGENNDEIWINKKIKNKKSTVEGKELTLKHELVHIRRIDDDSIDEEKKYDEDETELEAIVRTPKKYLSHGERMLHDLLRTGKEKKLSPNNEEDLKEIYKNIKKVIETSKKRTK
jgi:hypothetical protein